MTYNYRNIPIHYESYGEGEAMVLLHGFLESSQMWSPLISELSKKGRVIIIDFPGFGKSGVISETHTTELMAEVVAAVLDHLHIEKVTMVGHSMGGYVTMAFADLFPERLEKLVLLNSTPVADTPQRKTDRNRALKIIAKNPTAFISMAISNWAGERSREKFSQEIEASKSLALTFPIQGITAALRGMRDREDRTEVLNNFPREKYLFLAEDDPIIPLEENLELAKECGAETKVVEGGHLSMIENFESVRDFLLSIQ